MKIELTLGIVKALRLERLPVGVSGKRALLTKPNPTGARYILWDAHQSAPPGFGVRVSDKKTYIIRRKVHGKSIMPTVGNVADFLSIEDARKKAGEMASQILATGKNPNAEARRASAAEATVGDAFARYREHLVTRKQKPATEATLKVVDRAVRKFVAWGWAASKVKNLLPSEIEKKFLEGAKLFPTANEQAFQWAHAAVRWVIDMETLEASVEGRPSALTANTFVIIHLNKLIRSIDQLEVEREEGNKRNPLGPATTLGPFLEAAWSKKNSNDNETGIHYLILMLLWGCRKSEHAECVWGELLPAKSDEGPNRRNTSHVWLEQSGDYGPYVFFHKTKNGRNHRLPLGPMAIELLRRRQESAAREAVRRGFGSKSRRFVFPAKNKTSKTGHYTDSTDLLRRLRDEIGVERLTRHDLRRSFGAAMTAIDVPESIKSRFLNHANTKVTETYTKAEWALFLTWMKKIEQGILSTAPNVYNSLKPEDWPALASVDPHVCKPALPRSGRPNKEAKAARELAAREQGSAESA